MLANYLEEISKSSGLVKSSTWHGGGNGTGNYHDINVGSSCGYDW